MMRLQVPSRAQSLNHKPIPQVNSLASKLMDGKFINSIIAEDIHAKRVDYLANEALVVITSAIP
jgi:hypothetical protein